MMHTELLPLFTQVNRIVEMRFDGSHIMPEFEQVFLNLSCGFAERERDRLI